MQNAQCEKAIDLTDIEIFKEILTMKIRLDGLIAMLRRDDGSFTKDTLEKSNVLKAKVAQEGSKERYIQDISVIRGYISDGASKVANLAYINSHEAMYKVMHLKLDYLKMRTTFSKVYYNLTAKDKKTVEQNQDLTVVDPEVGRFSDQLKELMRRIVSALTQNIEKETHYVHRQLVRVATDILQLCAEELLPKLTLMMVDAFAKQRTFVKCQKEMKDSFCNSIRLAKQAITAITNHPKVKITAPEALKKIGQIEEKLIQQQKAIEMMDEVILTLVELREEHEEGEAQQQALADIDLTKTKTLLTELKALAQICDYLNNQKQKNQLSYIMKLLAPTMTILAKQHLEVLCDMVFVNFDNNKSQRLESLKDRSVPLFKMIEIINRLLEIYNNVYINEQGVDDSMLQLQEAHSALRRLHERCLLISTPSTIENDLFKKTSKLSNVCEVKLAYKNRINATVSKTVKADALSRKAKTENTVEAFQANSKHLIELRKSYLKDVGVVLGLNGSFEKNASATVHTILQNLENRLLQFYQSAIAKVIVRILKGDELKSLLPTMKKCLKDLTQYPSVVSAGKEKVGSSERCFDPEHIQNFRILVWCIELLSTRGEPQGIFAHELLPFISKKSKLKQEYTTRGAEKIREHLCPILVRLVNNYVAQTKKEIPDEGKDKAAKTKNNKKLKNAINQILKILQNSFADHEAAKACLDQHKDLAPKQKKKKRKKKNNNNSTNDSTTAVLAALGAEVEASNPELRPLEMIVGPSGETQTLCISATTRGCEMPEQPPEKPITNGIKKKTKNTDTSEKQVAEPPLDDDGDESSEGGYFTPDQGAWMFEQPNPN